MITARELLFLVETGAFVALSRAPWAARKVKPRCLYCTWFQVPVRCGLPVANLCSAPRRASQMDLLRNKWKTLDLAY